jgi:ribosomal-protein-alanine N-acetyltransferase
MARAAGTGSRLNIRPASLKDFDDLLFIEEQAHIYPWPESTLHWCLDQPNLRCFILQKNRETIGFAIYECVLDEANLLNIAINPAHHGQGHGRTLLKQSLHKLDDKIVRIILEVRVSNSAALTLYTSEGFTEIGHRKNYYPSYTGREDARVFALDLAAYRQSPCDQTPDTMLRKG